MGLFQRAYETYCEMEQTFAGVYEGEEREPLAPVGHTIKKAAIELTIDTNGNFVDGKTYDKNPPPTLIPTTEESLGRSGKEAYKNVYPLSEQLKHILAEDNYYIPALTKWAESDCSHEKVRAVLKYLLSGTLQSDLLRFGLIKCDDKGKIQNTDDFIRWRVLDDSDEQACWRDKSLFDSFIKYYASMQQSDNELCMVTGEIASNAKQHPKGVFSLNGNAKLISANDSSGFTYRGRFAEDSQAVTVSYDASQKAHNALRWLIANQSVSFGGRAFICWNPQGKRLPKHHFPLLFKEEKSFSPTEYQEELKHTLFAWQQQLPENLSAVIAAFDAATPGRLALTYYSEMPTHDLLKRIYEWDRVCCWYNGKFGVQSPRLRNIADYAFGTPRSRINTTVFETDDRVLNQQMQRLISCRVDGGKMPADFVRNLLSRASNLQIIDGTGTRENLLSTTCAVIRKYHYDKNGEVIEMALDKDKKDLSYQYGRLLAVLEMVERTYYWRSGEDREPNAIRLQSSFVKRPLHTFKIIDEQLQSAYYPRLDPRAKVKFRKLTTEIIQMLSECEDFEKSKNSPLTDMYIIGYYLQKEELYKKTTDENNGTEEMEEV